MPNLMVRCAATPIWITVRQKPATATVTAQFEHPSYGTRQQPADVSTPKLGPLLAVRLCALHYGCSSCTIPSAPPATASLEQDEYECTAEKEGSVSLVHVFSPPHTSIPTTYPGCVDIKPVFPSAVVRQPAHPYCLFFL